MPSFSDPRVVCRPALPSDTVDVLEFTKYIWEGHDYIHEVWKDWLADPHGLLVTAQFGLQTVGIAKVSLISPGQWWLEGLRVDPRFQGLKIGSHLHEYTDSWWLKHGNGIIRLMTSSQRVQIHHLSERTGYWRIGEVLGHRLNPPTADEKHAFQPVAPEDLPGALAFTAARLSHSNGLMDSGWRFSTPDETTLKDLAQRGRLYWWRGRLGLLAVHEDEEDEGPVLAIGFAATQEAPLLADLLRSTGVLAREQRFAFVHWLAPVNNLVRDALQQARFFVDWDSSGYLYAKQHPGP
jgi:GNAT superfamily N-acetyltransferase